MKQLLIALMVCLPLLSLAQNGGQSHSNQFVSISNFGYVVDGYNIKITNKTDCATFYDVKFDGANKVQVGPVAANSSLIYHYVAPENCSIKVQVKPIPPPCAPGPDMGQVEAKCMEGPDIIITPLPVQWIKQPQLVKRKI